MGITLIIVGGVVLITVIATVTDYLGKRKGKPDRELEERVASIEKKYRELEERVSEKDARIAQLESDISFVNKLIEDKSK